jgi:threonine/homoserine/homoserine lactone efflux protein
MSSETWFTFVAASTALVIVPGPTVLLVVSYALGQGWRAAFPMAVGVALGDFTAMTLSLLGIGTLLMASATIFMVVKWIGAAYLVYLGIKLFRSGGSLDAEPRTAAASGLRMLTHAWFVTTSNPKGLLFFVAFLPQFIDANASILSQVLILESTFVVLAFANTLTYAALASRARHWVKDERIIKSVNQAGGAILVSAGIATAAVWSSN